jgi:hypothetical protein
MIKKIILTSLIFFSASLSLAAVDFSSEVVAQVGKEVVTSRKIQADSVLENFWKSSDSKYQPLRVHTSAFQEELDRFLIERVVYLESKSLSLVQVENSEVQKQKRSFLNAIKKSESASREWDKLKLSDEETTELVHQKLAAQKFVEFKSRSSLVPVTEAEAFNFYQNNKKKFPGKEYKQIKESIKKDLAREQAQQRLSDWYDILRKKYEVTKVVAVGNS